MATQVIIARTYHAAKHVAECVMGLREHQWVWADRPSRLRGVAFENITYDGTSDIEIRAEYHRIKALAEQPT